MVSLLCLALAAPPLDPEAASEYRWRVGVRFDPPAAFALDFRDRFGRELLAALRPLIGDVGRCEVHDLRKLPDTERTPLERRFLVDGWSVFDKDYTKDGFEVRTLTGVKHHLVRVSVRSGVYTVEARQLDGTSGLASPQVRTRSTRDPQTVAREAQLLLGPEFGAVGTVERDPKQADVATIRFKGGLRPGFDRLAKAGDIFAVGLIREKPRPIERDKRGRPIPPKSNGPTPLVCQPQSYVLLRLEADPKAGAARCKVLSAYREPLPTFRDVIAIRCLKLLTQDAPVAVRVVGDDGKPVAAGGLLVVRATDAGFDIPPDPRDGLELRDGVYRSSRPLRDVACVVVGLGGGGALRYPIALTGSGPFTVRFNADPAAVARAGFERECEDFRGRVAEAVVNFAQLQQSLSDLIVKGKNPEALVRAKQGLSAQEAEDKALSAELTRLRGESLATDPRSADLLASAERQIQALREVRPAIQQKADELAAAAVRAQDPAVIEREFRAKELVARIKQLVEVGEVPEALELYDQLIEVTSSDDTRKQKDQLAAEWKPKDAAHERARGFVIDTWRRLPSVTADIRAASDKLDDVVRVLITKEDRLGLRLLLASFEPLYVKLKTIADKLDPNGETDKPKRERLTELATDLRKQEQSVRAAVQKIEGAK